MLRSGKMINKMYALSKWMGPLSHGDVTFRQEAKDEMLREDFVPPGCMAECWVRGCWPRHSITSASPAAAAAALSCGPCPSLTYTPWQNPSAAHKTIKNDARKTLVFNWKICTNNYTNISCHHRVLCGTWWEWKPRYHQGGSSVPELSYGTSQTAWEQWGVVLSFSFCLP